jgi:hypothetical protein
MVRKDSVADVTPYEHELGVAHGDDHFWDAIHHDRDLEDQLRSHYIAEKHDLPIQDLWKEPFHE